MKTKHIFYVSLASLSDKKDKETRKQKAYFIILLWLYNLNDFLLLSHPSLCVLVCFILCKHI